MKQPSSVQREHPPNSCHYCTNIFITEARSDDDYCTLSALPAIFTPPLPPHRSLLFVLPPSSPSPSL